MPVDYLVPEIPLRMRGLKQDAQGRPVPWFAADRPPAPYITVNAQQRRFALQHRICWICGQHLGAYSAFLLDATDTLLRQSFDPPLHKQCAVWWCGKGRCPVAATGVCAIYVTQGFRMRTERTLELGPPIELAWWREGRPALRTESEAALESALALLEATEQPSRLRLLRRRWSENFPLPLFEKAVS